MKLWLQTVVVCSIALSVSTFCYADTFYKGTSKEIAFSKREMGKVLEVYEEGRIEDALSLLTEAYDKAEVEFSNTAFFRHCVWKEGQIGTGEVDAIWGYRLFDFLWQRELKINPWKETRLLWQDYALLDNMVDCLTEAGQYRRAARYAIRIEKDLIEKGIDTQCRSYRKRTAVFSFTPEARLRDFPIWRRDLDRDSAGSGRRLNPYTEQYGLLGIIPFALRAGDWMRAAELSVWYIQFADEFANTEAAIRSEVCRFAGRAYQTLADICLRKGHPEEACRFYEEIIEKRASRHYRISWEGIALIKLELALAQLHCGAASEDMLAVASKAEEKVDGNTKYWRHLPFVRLKKARILHALGRRPEAWVLIDRVLEEAQGGKTPHRRTRLLPTVIELAMKDGGRHPDLEEWFTGALENEREFGGAMGELPIHKLYVDYLTLHDRSEEADLLREEIGDLTRELQDGWRELMEECLSGAKDHDWNARMQQARDSNKGTVKKSQKKSGTRSKSAAAKKITTKPKVPAAYVPVDIQPEKSMFTVRTGESANGRIYLYNPSVIAQRGELSLSGSFESFQEVDNHWSSLRANPALPNTIRIVDVKIPARDSYVIDVRGEPLSAQGEATIDCKWVVSGQDKDPVRSSWSYSWSSDTNTQHAVVEDIHVVRCGKGYMVPITHTVSLGESGSTNVDFKVQSAVAARIEVYEGMTGELLAVDANGDGDYEDDGDQVACDRNGNSWPDLVCSPDQCKVLFTMYIQLLEPIEKGDSKELTVSILEDEEWSPGVVDILRGKK